MSNDQFDDLKQFIDSRISQSEARFDENLNNLETSLTTKMEDGFAGVGEAIESIHEQHVQFDSRITKLEQAA